MIDTIPPAVAAIKAGFRIYRYTPGAAGTAVASFWRYGSRWPAPPKPGDDVR